MLKVKRTNPTNLPVKKDLNLLLSFQDDLNHFFENTLPRSMWSDLPRMSEMAMNFSPSIDIKETEKEYQVKADLPGLSESNIDLFIENNCLVMKGKRVKEEKRDKEDNYHMERSFGSFYRSVPFPSEIEDEKVNAKYKNGVLNITVAKSDEAVNSKRKIMIQKN